MTLNDLTISEAREKLRKKEIKATELTEACLSAIEAGNEALNAFLLVTADKAMDAAKESDKRLASKSAGDVARARRHPARHQGSRSAPRASAPRRARTSSTASSPAYELTVTQNLWDAGAVMLGKLNMDEFAMGSSNETSYYGPCVSPWRAEGSDEKIAPGGSSGGSASAVAARLCLGATASDTGGSIRQPAAFTGTVGIKPTYGRCSRWGMVAFASSLDQAGPLARSVKDAALLLQAMASYDLKDSTSVDRPLPDLEKELEKPLKGLRIGIPREYRVDGMSAEIDALWKKGVEIFKDAGAKIVDISLPHTKAALPAYYIVAPAEASSNLARYDGVRYGLRVNGGDVVGMYEETRSEGFGAEVKRRILIGTYVLSAGYYDAYYLKAQKVRSLIKRDFDLAFEKVDVDPDAGDADARLRAWQPRRRRSHRDVFERHLHRDGEHGGPPRAIRAGRVLQPRIAAWPPDHRQAVRRSDRASRGPGDRARGRAHAHAAALVGRWRGRRQARGLEGADPEEVAAKGEIRGRGRIPRQKKRVQMKPKPGKKKNGAS